MKNSLYTYTKTPISSHYDSAVVEYASVEEVQRDIKLSSLVPPHDTILHSTVHSDICSDTTPNTKSKNIFSYPETEKNQRYSNAKDVCVNYLINQSQRHSSIENQYAQVDDRSKLSRQNSKGSCSNLAIASSVHATTEECPSPHYEETSTKVESEVYYSTVAVDVGDTGYSNLHEETTQQKGSLGYDSTVASLKKNINEEELVSNNAYESHALTAVPNNCYEEELVRNQSHTPTTVCHEEELVTNNAYESHTLMACST